jgi:hypothetical protein
MTTEYWLKERKEENLSYTKAFVRVARYSFFDRVNFHFLVNFIIVIKDHDFDKTNCL